MMSFLPFFYTNKQKILKQAGEVAKQLNVWNFDPWNRYGRKRELHFHQVSCVLHMYLTARMCTKAHMCPTQNKNKHLNIQKQCSRPSYLAWIP